MNNNISLYTDELYQKSYYLLVVEAFSRLTYGSVYIIDYQKKTFDFISNDSLFLCGHRPEEVQRMGYYTFYSKYVPKENLELLLKADMVGLDFLNKVPISERLSYTITYDFHLEKNVREMMLVNQKITPILLTDEGKVWKAMCLVSVSEKKSAGNVAIYRENENFVYVYDVLIKKWRKQRKIKLSNREKEILIYSAKGYSMHQIADIIFVTIDTVKFHRKKIFDKLGVSKISEAILLATKNKLM